MNSSWGRLGKPDPPHHLPGMLRGQRALIHTAVIMGLLGCHSSHTVSLSWVPSTSLVVGYNVYRSTQSGGPYTKLNSSPIAATTYTDRTVRSGQTYFYVVKAVSSNKVESVASEEVPAKISRNTWRFSLQALRNVGNSQPSALIPVTKNGVPAIARSGRPPA